MNNLFCFRTLDKHLVNKLVVLSIFGLIPVFICCNKQSDATGLKDYGDEILKQIYPFIRTISNGPQINAELEPGRPNKQGEHSYYFRLVVKMYETWDLIYLERISILDEEGIDRRLTDHIFVDLKDKFPETSRGEFRYIESIEWLNDFNAKLIINEKEYVLNLRDFL